MLATASFFSEQNKYSHTFMPAIPSPLSPRSANVRGNWRQIFSMSPPDETLLPGEQGQRPKEKENAPAVPFSKRPIKKAPVGNAEDSKEKRRNLFLKKVKEGRDDKRFQMRGDDIMRLDFVRERKAWEAEQARSAPDFSLEPPEQEDEEEDISNQSPLWPHSSAEFSQPSTQKPLLENEVDDVAQQENAELEALLGFLPTTDMFEEPTVSTFRQSDFSSNLWSDDDDYDAIFAEFADDGTIHQGYTQDVDYSSNNDAMDMS